MSENADIQELRRLIAKVIQDDPVHGPQIVSTIALQGVSRHANGNLAAITPQPSIEAAAPQSSRPSTGNVKSVPSTGTVISVPSTGIVKSVPRPANHPTKAARGTTKTPVAKRMTNMAEIGDTPKNTPKAVQAAHQAWSGDPLYGEDILTAVFGGSSLPAKHSLSPTAPAFYTPTKAPRNTAPARQQEQGLPLLFIPHERRSRKHLLPTTILSTPSKKYHGPSFTEPEAKPTVTQAPRKQLPSTPEANSSMRSTSKGKILTGNQKPSIGRQRVSIGKKLPANKNVPKSGERRMNELLKSIISHGPNIPDKTD